MLDCVSEVRQSLLESREVLANLFDGGSTVREHSGHEFNRVSVPVLGQARLLVCPLSLRIVAGAILLNASSPRIGQYMGIEEKVLLSRSGDCDFLIHISTLTPVLVKQHRQNTDHYEYGQHPASNESKEELRRPAGDEERIIARELVGRVIYMYLHWQG